MTSVLSCFTAFAILATGQTAPPRQQTRQITASPKLVTGSYFRIKRPQALIDMATQVRAGQLPPRLLTSLAGPNASKLLLTRSAAPLSTVKADKGKLNKGNAPGAGNTVTAAPNWSSVIGSTILSTPKLIDFSPSVLNYPKLWDGEKADQLLVFTAPTDGRVSASLAEDYNFKIAEMRVYDAAGPSVPPAKRIYPPWDMPVVAGQTVGVVVRFEPKLKFPVNMAGQKSATLEIGGGAETVGGKPKWNLSVPVKGFFNGKHLGVIAFPDNPEIQVISEFPYQPDFPQEFKAKIVLLNGKPGMTGTVKAKSLPKGVTMPPFDFTIDEEGKKVLEVPLSVNRKSQDSVWNDVTESAHNITLQTQVDNQTSELGFYMIIFPGFHVWSFDEDVSSCLLGGDFTMYGDGKFHFSTVNANENYIFSAFVTYRGGFDGSNDHINMGVSVPRNDAVCNSYGFYRPEFEQGYTSYIHKPLTIHIHVELRG